MLISSQAHYNTSQKGVIFITKEIWKDIKDFEGFYQISNLGNVKALERKVSGKLGSLRTLPEKLMIPTNNGYGYLVICLCKYGKRYDRKIHRLVAEAFIPNPNNLPTVNHIDGNKLNNCVDNLEWNTIQENCRHRQNTGLGNIEAATVAKYKPVMSVNVATGENNSYNSLKEAAADLDCTVKGISKVLRGECKTHKGYRFEYIDK